MKLSISVGNMENDTSTHVEVDFTEDDLSDVALLAETLEDLLKPHFEEPKF